VFASSPIVTNAGENSLVEDADRPSAEKDFRDGKHGNRVFWRKNDTQPKRTVGLPPSQEGWEKP
jgi:hypothetical protein